MAVETSVLLFLTFFQLAGALALAQRSGPNPEAGRLLAALLVLNATLSAIRALEIEGGPSHVLDTTRALVDLPSALLIAAVAFALMPEGRLRRAAIAVGAVSLLHPLVALVAPPLLQNHYTLFFAIPYHVAVGALVWTASKREGEERWIALAFLPRALYFSWQAGHGLMQLGVRSTPELFYKLTVLGLFVVCVVALVRLVRRSNMGPQHIPMTLITLSAVVGPTIAIAQGYFADPLPPGIVLLDLLTLALIRPAFLYIGLLPGRFASMLVNALAGAGVGTLVVNVTRDAMDFPATASALLGFATGLMTLALADYFIHGPRLALYLRRDPQEEPDASFGESEDAALASGLPHWQRLVLELRGSSGGPADGPGQAAWTQKELSARTGISVKRVSEFPFQLNEAAETRLDAHVPGWREQHRGRTPRLVEVHRGAVRGMAGARVFYRLTPAGERLAEALARETASQQAPPPQAPRSLETP